MKCIIKALAETEYLPRAKWWGFIKDGKRYLMRYRHTMVVWNEKRKVVYAFHETVTDKRGVEFAIKYFKNKK